MTDPNKIRSVSLMGIPVAALTMEETIRTIVERIEQGIPTSHAVLNALKFIEMEQNQTLYDYIKGCDIVNADGQFVVILARLLGTPLPRRVTGCDLMQEMVAVAHQKDFRIFLLGGAPEVVAEVARKYTDQYGPDFIAGYRDGYFSAEEEPAIIEQIVQAKPDLLFVAFGSPKQEIFLHTHRERLLGAVKFMTGVGGTFDVIAGRVARAPLLFRKLGLEWLYRIIREPQRLWKKKIYRLPLLFFYILRMSRRSTSDSR